MSVPQPTPVKRLALALPTAIQGEASMALSGYYLRHESEIDTLLQTFHPFDPHLLQKEINLTRLGKPINPHTSLGKAHAFLYFLNALDIANDILTKEAVSRHHLLLKKLAEQHFLAKEHARVRSHSAASQEDPYNHQNRKIEERKDKEKENDNWYSVAQSEVFFVAALVAASAALANELLDEKQGLSESAKQQLAVSGMDVAIIDAIATKLQAEPTRKLFKETIQDIGNMVGERAHSEPYRKARLKHMMNSPQDKEARIKANMDISHSDISNENWPTHNKMQLLIKVRPYAEDFMKKAFGAEFKTKINKPHVQLSSLVEAILSFQLKGQQQSFADHIQEKAREVHVAKQTAGLRYEIEDAAGNKHTLNLEELPLHHLFNPKTTRIEEGMAVEEETPALEQRKLPRAFSTEMGILRRPRPPGAGD